MFVSKNTEQLKCNTGFRIDIKRRRKLDHDNMIHICLYNVEERL